MTRIWVLIQMVEDGKVAVWRDYGITWGSPIYQVLGYFKGSHRDAMKRAKELAV